MKHLQRRRTRIDTLREHPQWAIELEHTTLPHLLNPEAVEVVGSVFAEEMPHRAPAAAGAAFAGDLGPGGRGGRREIGFREKPRPDTVGHVRG